VKFGHEVFELCERTDRQTDTCPHRNAPLRPRQKGEGSPYSITERGVPELILVLGSQPAGDVSHKPSGRLAVTPTLKRTATSFAAW